MKETACRKRGNLLAARQHGKKSMHKHGHGHVTGLRLVELCCHLAVRIKAKCVGFKNMMSRELVAQPQWDTVPQHFGWLISTHLKFEINKDRLYQFP